MKLDSYLGTEETSQAIKESLPSQISTPDRKLLLLASKIKFH